MRKKTLRKLELHRETLRLLDTAGAAQVRGGTESDPCTQPNSMCPIETCSCQNECTGVEVF